MDHTITPPAALLAPAFVALPLSAPPVPDAVQVAEAEVFAQFVTQLDQAEVPSPPTRQAEALPLQIPLRPVPVVAIPVTVRPVAAETAIGPTPSPAPPSIPRKSLIPVPAPAPASEHASPHIKGPNLPSPVQEIPQPDTLTDVAGQPTKPDAKSLTPDHVRLEHANVMAEDTKKHSKVHALLPFNEIISALHLPESCRSAMPNPMEALPYSTPPLFATEAQAPEQEAERLWPTKQKPSEAQLKEAEVTGRHYTPNVMPEVGEAPYADEKPQSALLVERVEPVLALPMAFPIALPIPPGLPAQTLATSAMGPAEPVSNRGNSWQEAQSKTDFGPPRSTPQMPDMVLDARDSGPKADVSTPSAGESPPLTPTQIAPKPQDGGRHDPAHTKPVSNTKQLVSDPPPKQETPVNALPDTGISAPETKAPRTAQPFAAPQPRSSQRDTETVAQLPERATISAKMPIVATVKEAAFRMRLEMPEATTGTLPPMPHGPILSEPAPVNEGKTRQSITVAQPDLLPDDQAMPLPPSVAPSQTPLPHTPLSFALVEVTEPSKTLPTVPLIAEFPLTTTASSPPQQAAAALAQNLTPETSKIEVTLTPEELGTLRFEIHRQGDDLNIVMSAERPETLDLMRRNLPDLMAELKQAGVSGGTLSFGQWADRGQEKAQTAFATRAEGEAPPSPPPPISTKPRSSRGLDLRL